MSTNSAARHDLMAGEMKSDLGPVPYPLMTYVATRALDYLSNQRLHAEQGLSDQAALCHACQEHHPYCAPGLPDRTLIDLVTGMSSAEIQDAASDKEPSARQRQERQQQQQQQAEQQQQHEPASKAQRADSKVDGDDTISRADIHAASDTLRSVPSSDELNTVPAPLNTIAQPLTHRSVSPVGVDLHIRTDIETPTSGWYHAPTFSYDASALVHARELPSSLASTSNAPGVGSTLRSNLSASSIASSTSPGSALPSPYLAAISDLTPLPSPVSGQDSTPPWRNVRTGTPNHSRPSSVDDTTPKTRSSAMSPTSPKRKKGYGSLMQEAALANAAAAQGSIRETNDQQHTRARSISDFIPETLQNVRQRVTTFGSSDAAGLEATERHMHREAHLAVRRGLAGATAEPSKQIPTPPPSNSSVVESDDADDEQPTLEDGTRVEYLHIHCGIHNKRRKFRQLRQLGQGTFSTVMLATRQHITAHPTPEIEQTLDPHQLVAVKIIQNGPAGGADQQRVETSLRREVELLKSISHPSLIHLKACEYQERRALLVLTYCPGGDLFEFASEKRDILTPGLVQRMFAELVSAVQYLHSEEIVHRDIKLENVLVNIPDGLLRAVDDPTTYPTPLVTLTDLGLGRRIPQPPESPLLHTRCGSEDYAAPEILLGQAYDGRLTDSWALGIVLYALMEGRLPFDAPPGKPDRSRNTHRIARCDWIWCRFGNEDGEWDMTRGKDWDGAQLCVEGLLRKVRMGRKSLQEIGAMEWVQRGIKVLGGLKMRAEDDDDDALS
nr:serine/threonine-protein kinase prr1 [Quercus suber]